MRKADDAAPSLDRAQSRAADLGMKGMIPIGRPFLDYVISALADAGFERVCLVVGPEHDAVRDYYIREQPPSRIEIEFATQEKPLGTADAVLAAELFAGGESFVVLNSDNYYPIAALAQLRHSDAPAIIGFARSALLREGNVQADRVERFGALTIDGDGYLVRMVPRQGDAVPTYHGDVYASMNCWLFDSRIFDACRNVPMSPRNELELTRAVQLAIDEMGMKIKVVTVDLPVLDLSTRSDIYRVQKILATTNVRL